MPTLRVGEKGGSKIMGMAIIEGSLLRLWQRLQLGADGIKVKYDPCDSLDRTDYVFEVTEMKLDGNAYNLMGSFVCPSPHF